MPNDQRQLFKNTLILTVTSIVMRSVSLSFTLYLRGKLGEEGVGLFSLVMNLFSFAATLATGGVSLVTTRLVSEALGRDDPAAAKAAFRKCLGYALFFGFFACLLLILTALPLGRYALGDDRTVPSLYALALSLPCLALSSSFSGYFTATRRVSKSAAVQLAEQFCRIAVTVGAFTLLAPKTLTFLCLFVVLGAVVSDLLSCLLSGLLCLYDARHHLGKTAAILPKGFQKTLLSIALPIAFSTYFRSALVTIEHLLIPKGLIAFGLSRSEALAVFGVLEGMALPILLFPYALLTPYCNLLMPEIARNMAKKNRIAIAEKAADAITFTVTFGIGAAAVMLTLPNTLGRVLCQNEEAGKLIAALAPLLPIMYTDTAVDAVLKGANEQVFTMRVNLLDALLGVALAFFTVPRFGIFGYVFNIIACEIVNFSLSITRLYKIAPPKLSLCRLFLLPLFSATLAAFFMRRLLPLFSLSDKFSLFLAIALFGILYTGTTVFGIRLLKVLKNTAFRKKDRFTLIASDPPQRKGLDAT